MSSTLFATSLADLGPLTVAIPFGLAALLASRLPFPFTRRHAELVAAGGALAVAVLCVLLLREALDSEGPVVSRIGGWQPRGDGVIVGINFAFDPLGAALALLAAVLVGAALVFAWRFFDAVGPTFHALMLVFLGALTGFALTGDLFNMFVFFELMSVSAYALTAYRIERAASLQGALTFAVTNSLGAVMILFGIALLYGRTGALNLAQVGEALASRPSDGLVVTAFALITGGFLVKAAIVPFHFWLADAYAVAPTPAAIVFTGVMSDLGIYAVARIYLTVFQAPLEPHVEGLRAVLVGFAVVTALLGALLALVQNHLKRLLAFVTISQIGLALIGVGLLTPEGVAGATLLIPADGLLRAGLFVCLGAILHRCGSVYQSYLHGRGRVLPKVFPVFFGAAVLGLAALPPVGAYPGKALVEEAAGEVGYGWVSIVFLVATVVAAAALLRAGARVFFGWGAPHESDTDPREPPAEESELTGSRGRVPGVMFASVAVLIVAGLLVAAVPGAADDAQRSAHAFADREAYAAPVLGRPPPPGEPVDLLHGGALEIVLGLLTALGSIALAAALLRDLVPLPRPVRMGFETLRRQHSGQIGDYVAWATVGFALLGGLCALAT
ncbi:MAG TPA: proton-conducting transporter membrane subunit [Solirubrobacteraceae bacterium]|nr:proton-conducting transporter membrane subunit [Solirubrobacteraceae bacterium]